MASLFWLSLLLGSTCVSLAYVCNRNILFSRNDKLLFANNIPRNGGGTSDKYQKILSDYIENDNNDTTLVQPNDLFFAESDLIWRSALLDFIPTKLFGVSKPKSEGVGQESLDLAWCGITTRAWESLEEVKEKGSIEEKCNDIQGNDDIDEYIVETPKTKAWQVLEDVIEASEEDYEKPVITLEEYLNGEPLDLEHVGNIKRLWKMIRIRGVISSLSEEDRKKVKDALTVAYITLWGRRTSRSLENCINRATGVAGVLGDLEQDVDMILAGILTEVVTVLISTKAFDHVSTLVHLFGREAISLADMYSRLPKFFARKTEYSPMQSENQVQMLVQMSEDPRVLLLRLADRLHTMRFLSKLPLDDMDRLKISQESLNVYAPLAHKMGLNKIKGEFEDLSFKSLNPVEFGRARLTQTDCMFAYYDAADSINKIIENDPLLLSCSITMSYRVKDRYQLYLKMLKKNLNSSHDVRDALGLRLIVNTPKRPEDSVQDHIKRGADICYYLIERLRNMPGWEPESTERNGFKDYIKGVKDNGYQSLHQYIRHVALTTNVEVQVRTTAMHQFAELGEAAHWCYKDLIYRPEIANSRYYKIAWRSPRQLKVKTAQELIALARIQLKNARVFVYLEDKSTVLNLKQGSTALDAAFSIHTDVGMSTLSIEVNGRPASYGNALTTGDEIRVQCAPNKRVLAKTSWLTMVQSRQAKFALKRYFHENQRGTLVCLGLVQLLMILFQNKDRVEARYNGKLPDATKLRRLCKDRTGMTISTFLDKLGTFSGRGDTSQLVSRLLDIPTNQLQISLQTMALIWGRMQDSHQGPAVPYIDELRLNVLHPFVFDILPEEQDGVRDAFSLWSQVIGPRLISNQGIEEEVREIIQEQEQHGQEQKQEIEEMKEEVTHEVKQEAESDALNAAVTDISKEAYSCNEEYRDRVVLSTQVPKKKKTNLYYLRKDDDKTHIYKDYRGGLRDIYTNYPLAVYKKTPRPISGTTTISHVQSEPMAAPGRDHGEVFFLKVLGNGRQPHHLSMPELAKKPFSLEASLLTQNNLAFHRFAKRIYADRVTLAEGGKEPH